MCVCVCVCVCERERVCMSENTEVNLGPWHWKPFAIHDGFPLTGHSKGISLSI